MRLKIAVLIVAIVTVSATLGATAFTTGSLERTSSMDVVTDESGLIALQDGTSGGLAANNNGEFTIDFTQGGATGANVNANFALGNISDPTNEHAFKLVNQDTTSHDITLEYTGFNSVSDSTDNLNISVYDNSGNYISSVTDESASTTLSSVPSGSAYYVVVEVDTTTLTTSNDLSGTLKVSV